MTEQSIDLGAVRRRVFTTYFQDGLFEMAAGLALAAAGAMVFRDAFSGMVYLPIMLFAMMLPAAKKRFVSPGVGYINLPSNRAKARLTILFLFTFLLGVLTFVLTLRSASTPSLQWFRDGLGWVMDRFPTVAGLVLAVVFSYLAKRSGIARFYGFAALFAVGGLGVALLEMEMPDRSTLLFVTTGSLMFIFGLVTFVRFLGENPLPDEEAGDGQA